jgi:hypothetical protein
MLDLLFYTFSSIKGSIMFGILFFFISIGIILLILASGGINFRKKYTDGFLKFGKAYLVCLYIVLVYTVIMLIYVALFYLVIDPLRAENELQMAMQMMDSFSIPEEAREQAYSSMVEKFTPTRLIIQSLANSLITGALIAIFAALIARKKEKVVEVY